MFWTSKARLERIALEHTNSKLTEELKTVQQRAHEQVLALERMNARLQGDLDWAKHRLNQVEKERAQLISAAIGVKVAVPEFLPAKGPDEEGRALHEMPDLSSIGEDANDGESLAGLVGTEQGVDYSMMPGYRKGK